MVTFSRYVSHLYRYTIKDYQTIDYAYCIGKKDLMEWYNDRQSFPPLMLLRRYIKLIYNYCYIDGMLDLKLDDPKLNNLPFSIKSLPINYPTPDKLQHSTLR